MTTYEKWKSGEMDWFIRQGLIRNAVVTYCRMYDEYLSQRKLGLNFMEAVESSAEIMNTSPDTIRRAITESTLDSESPVHLNRAS